MPPLFIGVMIINNWVAGYLLSLGNNRGLKMGAVKKIGLQEFGERRGIRDLTVDEIQDVNGGVVFLIPIVAAGVAAGAVALVVGAVVAVVGTAVTARLALAAYRWV